MNPSMLFFTTSTSSALVVLCLQTTHLIDRCLSINRRLQTFTLSRFSSWVGQCLLQRYGLLWFTESCHCLIYYHCYQ